MKKLTKVLFRYEDGTEEYIDDPRACLLFQSRLNTTGVVVGMEKFFVGLKEKKNFLDRFKKKEGEHNEKQDNKSSTKSS